MTLPAPRRTLRRRRLARTGALSGALLLALTACSGGGVDSGASSASTTTTAPAASSTSAAAASSTGGASASAPDATTSGAAGEYVPASSKGPAQNVPKPVTPAAVKENTPEGAEAAVKYWWEAADYLQQTNDSEPFKTISMEECDFCASYPKTINRIYSGHGWSTGQKPLVKSLDIQQKGDFKFATFKVHTERATTYDSKGTIVDESPTTPTSGLPWEMLLKYDEEDSKWVIREVQYVDSAN